MEGAHATYILPSLLRKSSIWGSFKNKVMWFGTM